MVIEARPCVGYANGAVTRGLYSEPILEGPACRLTRPHCLSTGVGALQRRCCGLAGPPEQAPIDGPFVTGPFAEPRRWTSLDNPCLTFPRKRFCWWRSSSWRWSLTLVSIVSVSAPPQDHPCLATRLEWGSWTLFSHSQNQLGHSQSGVSRGHNLGCFPGLADLFLFPLLRIKLAGGGVWGGSGERWV